MRTRLAARSIWSPSLLSISVQISKTLQANMDGDGIGGSVNLVTRTATDIPTLELEGIGGYTPIIHGRGNTTERGTWGRRFGTTKKFGVIVGGSFDWEGRGIDDLEPVPDVATLSNGSTRTWFDGTDIREYKYFRSRYGFAGSLDCRIREGSTVFARFLYSDFKNYGDRYDYSLVDNTPGISVLNPGNEGCPTGPDGVTTQPCSGVPAYNAQLRNPNIGVGSVLLSGNHVFTTTWYTWEAYAARSFYGHSPYSTAVFNSTLSTGACQFNAAGTTDKYLPQWDQTCYNDAYNHTCRAHHSFFQGRSAARARLISVSMRFTRPFVPFRPGSLNDTSRKVLL